MHISLRYACLICRKNIRRKRESNQPTDEIKRNPKLQEIKLKAALQQASEYGSLAEPHNIDMGNNGLQRSRSLARLEAQQEFLKQTSLAANTTFETEDSIINLDQAFSKFLTMYPKYQESEKIDELRVDEYPHLADHDSKVCLDYCGFGLFSFSQVVGYCGSCSFSLSELSTSLSNYALINDIEQQGTAEHDVKTRIMDYLNIPEHEYCLVLTSSRGSAFKLLAESYPFNNNKSLLTMFDHESQSVNWMGQRAKQKGAKVHSAWFKWPTLKPCSTHLRKRILNKRRRKSNSSKGLFVFPVQSRVTGGKYSYQWMSFAQQNNWHVLLDVGALGPLDMDSLGLSLFRPDFIITSFYRVFGYDPTGFGCLLIKKSVIKTLQKQPGHTRSGIVKINQLFTSNLNDPINQFPQFSGTLDNEGPGKHEVTPEKGNQNRLPVFSGVLSPSLIKEVYGGSPSFEDTGIFSVMKSPILTEEESPEDSMWIDLGNSPLQSQQNFETRLPPPFWFTRNNINNIKDFNVHPSNNTGNAETRSPEIQEVPEIGSSVIRRETEGDFMLLGRRNAFRYEVEDDDDYISEEEYGRKEAEIICRHLDHVNMLGLSKTTIRLRFLINWLVTSLLQLRLPGSGSGSGPLVHIYGPKIKYERGAAVAFNIRDGDNGLVGPEIVQKMAEVNGICVGVAIISNVKIIQSKKGNGKAMDVADTAVCRPMDEKNRDLEGFVRAEVVTASLGFLTNFEDVYKLWAFVAKFLDPSFVRRYGDSTLNESEES